VTEPKPQPPRWRAARRVFRWCRISVLLAVLALVAGFINLNQAGLPAFAKRRLQTELRARGLEVQFERVHLRWKRGIVAEQLRVTGMERMPGATFTAGEAEIRLDAAALRRFQLKVPSLQVRDGRLVWPVGETNQPPRDLVAENITTELTLRDDDTWTIAPFTTRVNGIALTLGGEVAHARELRQPKPPSSPTNAVPPAAHVRRMLDQLAQIEFSSPPSLEVTVHADAAADGGFRADVRAAAPSVVSPWGSGRDVLVKVQLQRAPGEGSALVADGRVKADSVKSRWLETSTMSVAFAFTNIPSAGTSPSSPLRSFAVAADLTANGLRAQQGEASTLRASVTARRKDAGDIAGDVTARASDVKSASFDSPDVQLTLNAVVDARLRRLAKSAGRVEAAAPRTRWASAERATVRFQLQSAAEQAPAKLDGLWPERSRWTADWSLDTTNLATTNLTLQSVACTGAWRAPRLELTALSARLLGGGLDATVSLDVATRAATAKAAAHFDYWRLAPLLGTNVHRLLAQYQSDAPPRVNVEGSVTLPAWTNRAPDWRGEVLPTLALTGRVEGGRGAFRSVPFDVVRTDVTLTNAVLHMPNLVVHRPEGRAAFSYTEDTRTRDFAFRGSAEIDPRAVRPLLEDDVQRRALDEFRFASPPTIEGEVRGRWFARERLGFDVNVALTNFAFRGEPASNAVARVRYTNQLFRVEDLRIGSGAQVITAPLALVDAGAERAWLTNVQSTFDPMPVARAIGRQTAASLAPYRFAKPPSVRLHGSVPLSNENTSDLHFEIAGGPFAWQRFYVPEIRGAAHWVTNSLVLTNIVAAFYGGEMQGDAVFEFARGRGADFRFALVVADASLHDLVADVSARTNKLEGTFSGVLSVREGHTEDLESWQGFGSVRLTNGLLWDVPLVGLFSPVLNAILPGVGSSRAREAKANFVITNSVIRTSDLEIRSPPVRLHYDGTVDFESKVSARVEAELFRDAFLVGPLLSFITTPITKVFEYKITGTLSQPEGEPTYVPKFLLLPLRPFHVLKQLIPGLDDSPKPPKPR